MAAPFTSPKSRRARPQGLDPASVQQFVEDLLGDDLYAQRVLSLANAVVGVLHAASLAIQGDVPEAHANARESGCYAYLA